MPKCAESRAVAAALNKFLSSGLPGANINAIHEVIVTSNYGGSLARNTIENFARTGRGVRRTVEIIERFLRDATPGFAPEQELEPVFLNIGQFFGMTQDKQFKMVASFAGHYQTYARSTSRPDRIRRGIMGVAYDPKWKCVRVTETQRRPQERPEEQDIQIDWEGYAVQRERRIFCVMRTTLDYGEATPLFQVMDIAEHVPPSGKYNALIARTMGVEELGKQFVTFPTVLIRRAHTKQPLVADMIDFDEFRQAAEGDAFLRSNMNLLGVPLKP